KAVIPGGISAKILRADEIDVAMDFSSLMAAGSMAGSGGVIVMDETTSMVEALNSAVRFFADESCGQCSPCREGTGWVHRIMHRITEGQGRLQDLDDLLAIAGDCRICLVEVEKLPKLQIACNTPVTEGMVVHTKNQKAEDGRRAVLEFLLANHPLDCPVCDQSGECDLQNFYLNFGLYNPRFRAQKVKKHK